ncbi:MAG TPA: choice-of-anchor D domain-containing protein, partial [Candidatus Acidoferrum sp.]
MKLAAAPFSVSKYVFRSATLALNFLFLACFPSRAQTPQPLLFAVSTSNNQYSASTFLRDDVAGTLTLLQTSALFKNPCVPSAIDAKGRFLFGMCAGGLSLYTYDSATGTIAEVAASPFATSTGNQSNLIVAESTGQYVYLLKINPASGPNSQSLFLDTFQIDSSTPALVPISSQTLPVLGSFVASAGDPNQHGMTIFLNQNATYAAYSTAVLYTITFDSTSGLARLDPVGGQNVGYNARSLAISPTGKYLAIGFGQATGSFSVYAIGASTFTLTSLGFYNLGPEGSSTFPDSIFFDPNGELIYVQAPPTNYSGGGLPFLIFDTATFLQLPSSPLPIADATFVAYLKDSQGPFAYASNNSNGVHGISVYLIDPGTGLASQPLPIDVPLYPQMSIDPILAPFGPSGGQGIGGPALTPGASSLTFSSTVVAQQNGPQTITLTSSGQESVSLTSIAISGANAADFLETDTCMSSPVLKAAATCAISVTYAPSSVGSSQASLFITDNAPGSPQQIALSG